MVKTRDQIAADDKWNVEAMFTDLDSWQKAFKEVAGLDQQPHWPDLGQYRGRLGDSPAVLKEALDAMLGLERRLSQLYTYAHLRHDEDIVNPRNKESYVRIATRRQDLVQEISWVEPELLGLPNQTLNAYLQAPELKDYHFHLQKIIRLKKHTLNPEQEELMAMSEKALQAVHRTFSALNDADFKFGQVADKDGKLCDLTHGTYGLYIRSQDRQLRMNAFRRLQGQYKDYQNGLSELLNGQVQRHLFEARARGYTSCVEAALYPKNIDVQVYESLVQTVRDNIDALHDYMALRKDLLGVDELHMYDVYVPLTAQVDMKLTYDEAQELVIQSSKPLGLEYLDQLRQGLLFERWVDRYENENKRSGAYSSGCFDSSPYILMNYKGVLRDVFTLAHEAGHSMHSHYSRRYQPFHYSSYPIFVAEVASTFNEELLMRHLVSKAKTKEERIFLINEKLEDIRTTLFRQTMFAEFELLIHRFAESDTPITSELLCNEYLKLNRDYFGPHVVVDPEVAFEWARIPHFYYNFYVYQYATGISAALALADHVTQGGESARDAYLSFLKGGCSRYPLDLLRTAGVDMRSPQPVQQAIARFRTLVGELRALTAPAGKAESQATSSFSTQG